MLSNIEIGKFSLKENFFQKIHPLNMILLMFLSSILVLKEQGIIYQVFLFLFFFLLLKMNKENISNYLKSIWYLKWIILGLLLLTILFQVEIENTILAILKMLNVLLLSQCLLSNVCLKDMIESLKVILSPLSIFKVSTNQLAFMLSLSIHFIPTILEAANRMIKSIENRGIIIKKLNFRKKLELLRICLRPLFYQTIYLSDQLSDTILLKQYPVDESSKIENWTFKDNIVLVISLYIFLIFLLKEVWI